MTVSVREFFESIEERLDPEKAKGTTAIYRFDVRDVGSWLVDVDDGRVTVTESDGDADCVLQASEELWGKLIRGEANATTAYMTGKLKVKGDLELALKLKELFF